MTFEAAQVGALLACGLTAAVVYRYRHATSNVARMAAGLAGGSCILLLISSGVLSFAPGGAGHMLTSAALVGLAIYALRQGTARQVFNGIFILMTWLLSLLPRSNPLVIPMLLGTVGMFAWFHLKGARG